MIVVRIFLALLLISSSTVGSSYSGEEPLTPDSRIKTYIYSPNEVFLLVLITDFNLILFGTNEIIETIILEIRLHGILLRWIIDYLLSRWNVIFVLI